jgi:3-dehydroquinate dehydratase type I
MKSKKADIIKLATFAKTFTDSIRMLAILAQLTSSKQKAICLCMGKEGRITRTASHLFGNFLMYAPISSTDKTAKGQLLAKQLKKIQNLTPK